MIRPPSPKRRCQQSLEMKTYIAGRGNKVKWRPERLHLTFPDCKFYKEMQVIKLKKMSAWTGVGCKSVLSHPGLIFSGDFGPLGLWMWTSDTWTQIRPLNAD
jgi:hypothetical protein